MTLPLFDIRPAAVTPPGGTLVFEARVYGIPAPQGSKKGFYNPKLGRVQMVESSKKVKPWREDVRAAAIACKATDTLDCPVAAVMVFTFVRPQAHYRTGRNSALLRDAAPARPAGMPDLSKLARSTEDALTSAAIYKDDSRLVEYHRLAKVYAGEDPDALEAPGAVIRLYLIGASS